MDRDKRDLYADLELPGLTNDVSQIKKQYKKLSLQKHPDRPGGSNEAFSIINHAHDVLTDPDKKRKFDNEYSRRNRTTHASGVRGNPWATAGQGFAPPPRPPNFPPRPAPTAQKRQTSTADKFAEMAGAARRQPKPADMNSQWQAWNDIRSAKNKANSAGQSAGASYRASASASRPPPPPPPVPPRAAPPKQPKGSFGARVQKNGYIPDSPGDEGAHSKDNYFTTRTHSNLFTETSTAARARRRVPPSPPLNAEDDDDDGGLTDERQSTPYQTQGGERFDPWNGSNIGRSRSTRETNRKPYPNDGEKSNPAVNARQRSASIPNVADSMPHAAQNGTSQRAASTTPASGGYQKSPKDSDTSRGKHGHQFFGLQAGTPTDSHRFTRNSTDNINTRFVDEEDANYQFSAGSPVAEDGHPAMMRTKSGSRAGRSPFSAPSSHNPFSQPSNSSNVAQNGSFDPAEWSEKIDPSIFEAPTPQKTPAPTSRPMRKSSKKPVRMTAGTAGMIDPDESSSGQDDLSKDPMASVRAFGHGTDGTASPTPMDIDPPMNAATDNGVRNIPVTPSRPEWRAGDVGLGIKNDAKPVGGQQSRFPMGGSEDTDEFRASFADLRNVEPFNERATGLDSFGDLKSNLPFPSAASGQAPIKKPAPQKKSFQLELPLPPKPPPSPAALGPNLGLKPSAATWTRYMDKFAQYVTEWHTYNNRFLDHFAARKIEVQARLHNLDWIASKDDAGLAEYYRWETEDHEVRDQWTAACNNHEMNVRSYMINRQKMMK